MARRIITTDQAPKAIGSYSQAVCSGNIIYLSGQIPLCPDTMELVRGDMRAQIKQVLDNLTAVCRAAGGSLEQIVKLNVYLVDLSHFALVNELMDGYFSMPYPARAVIGVAGLPRGASLEMDAIMELP